MVVAADVERPTGAVAGTVQVVVACPDLAASMAFYTERLGFAVDMIVPADSPTTAVVVGPDVTLRLEQAEAPAAAGLVLRMAVADDGRLDGPPATLAAPEGTRIEIVATRSVLDVPDGQQEVVVSRVDASDAWVVGRAGMHYRDLIPSRLGGRFIASHIRIPEGGDVADYVHFHRIRFQMIFCRRGSVRVVYEDQGEPFVLDAGDCVLQPPEIRHRVLESSPGAEVVELGCPAVHETHADRRLALPTGRTAPERLFGGQRFVRHVAADATWEPWRVDGAEVRDTGIAAATAGLAGARVLRSVSDVAVGVEVAAHDGELLFLYVLAGQLGVEGLGLGGRPLGPDDSCVVPAGTAVALGLDPGLELLEVTLPGALSWVPPAHDSPAASC